MSDERQRIAELERQLAETREELEFCRVERMLLVRERNKLQVALERLLDKLQLDLLELENATEAGLETIADEARKMQERIGAALTAAAAPARKDEP